MDGKTIKLVLGGKERRLSYDLNSIAEIGERLNIRVRLSSLGADLMERELPLRALRTLLWAGLVHEEPDLTEEEVGAWVTLDNVQEVTEYFFELFGGTGLGPTLTDGAEILAQKSTDPAEDPPTEIVN